MTKEIVKKAPTRAALQRSVATGGLAFLGPLVLQPLLEYGAALGKLDPQPSAEQLLAAATFLSGAAVAVLSYRLRCTKKEEPYDPYAHEDDPDGNNAGA